MQINNRTSNFPMRTFLAIPLLESNQTRIDQFIKSVDEPTRKIINWLPISQLHLTIKFIGEFNSTDTLVYQETLSSSISKISPFMLDFEGIGMFPNKNTPSVIWAGIGHSPQLLEIYNLVEATSHFLGYSKEKRSFSPHLTIGRVRKGLDQPQLKGIFPKINKIKQLDFGEIFVDHLVFFQSTLTSKGPLHSPLFKIQLSP